MHKSIDQINERIRDGTARVVTAEEMPAIVAELGELGALKEVDVVTTGDIRGHVFFRCIP